MPLRKVLALPVTYSERISWEFFGPAMSSARADGHHPDGPLDSMFAPEWDAGCRSCSGFLDQIGHLAHLNARGTTLVAVSRAPYTRILPFKARMGWTVPWYSSYGSEFNHDFEVTLVHEGELVERPGVSCFLRDRERVFHTYSTYERGLDGLGSTTGFLDLTALGRQEEWEEPKGRASALGAPAGSERVRYHDEYVD